MNKNMKYYMAPMEGVTGYIYRNALNEYFGEGIDRFYTPFVVPHEKRAMSSKEIKDICPENNKGYKLVPQILTNNAGDFGRLEKALREYGYTEVNLNLGCPSRTVAGKGRGSGFLSRLKELDAFLEEIFANRCTDISVKTRIGDRDYDDWNQLIEIFNKYPIKELTIHPRIRFEYYNGVPHRDIFYGTMAVSKNPLCYNGDVYSQADVKELIAATDNKLEAIMIGRGILANPALFRELTGGRALEADELREFLGRLRSDYSKEFSGDTPVLQKMKELWNYMRRMFPDKEKQCTDILKCKSINEYKMLELKILGS